MFNFNKYHLYFMRLNTFFWESVRRFHQSLQGVHGTKNGLRTLVLKKRSLRNVIHSWNLWNFLPKPPKFAKKKCNFPAEIWCGNPSVLWTQSEYHCKQKYIAFMMECSLSRASPYSRGCNTMKCRLCWSARSSVLFRTCAVIPHEECNNVYNFPLCHLTNGT